MLYTSTTRASKVVPQTPSRSQQKPRSQKSSALSCVSEPCMDLKLRELHSEFLGWAQRDSCCFPKVTLQKICKQALKWKSEILVTALFSCTCSQDHRSAKHFLDKTHIETTALHKWIMPHHYLVLRYRLRSLYWVGHCSMTNMYGLRVCYIDDIVSPASHDAGKSQLYVPWLDKMGHCE